MSQTLLSIAQSQVRYHRWATQGMWRGLESLPEADFTSPRGTSFGTIQATLTHMYLADRVWLNRLSGQLNTQVASIPVPRQSLLREAWNETLDELCSWTADLKDDALFIMIQYANSTGSLFRTPPWQILLHVVNHGTGHRGQVNGMIRQAGGHPFNSDLIQFYRLQNPEVVDETIVPS